MKTFKIYLIENTKFVPIKSNKTFNSTADNKKFYNIIKKNTYQFKAKDGNIYYIEKGNNQDIIRLYILNKKQSERYIDGKYESFEILQLKPIGTLVFEDKKTYFTTYDNNVSIEVEPEYRRKGLGSALIEFGEFILKKPYKPSDILSPSFSAQLKSMGRI